MSKTKTIREEAIGLFADPAYAGLCIGEALDVLPEPAFRALTERDIDWINRFAGLPAADAAVRLPHVTVRNLDGVPGGWRPPTEAELDVRRLASARKKIRKGKCLTHTEAALVARLIKEWEQDDSN